MKQVCCWTKANILLTTYHLPIILAVARSLRVVRGRSPNHSYHWVFQVQSVCQNLIHIQWMTWNFIIKIIKMVDYIGITINQANHILPHQIHMHHILNPRKYRLATLIWTTVGYGECQMPTSNIHSEVLWLLHSKELGWSIRPFIKLDTSNLSTRIVFRSLFPNRHDSNNSGRCH